jgi:magnesium chelatase family protein
VPEADAAEAALIPDLEVIPVGSLAALYNHLAGRKPIPPSMIAILSRLIAKEYL